jgi:hypothetical protein
MEEFLQQRIDTDLRDRLSMSGVQYTSPGLGDQRGGRV